MPAISSGSVSATTKSSPCSLKASTGPGAPSAKRLLAISLMSLLVMSGFCSEPDSANSFSMIDWVRMNQE